MRRVLERRPSASMGISLIALVVALSGTAVAAGTFVNGDQLIKKGSLSGNRLRKHTLTGRQINLRRLGTVPRAGTAGYAGSAGYAASAGSAANASNAGNAAALGGRPAAGYLTTGDRIGTAGTVKLAGTTAGSTTTLFSYGPFTVTMTCTTATTGKTSMSVNATSSESNSVIDSAYAVPAGTAINIGSFAALSTAQVTGGTYTFEAPSGAGLVVAGSFGTDSAGVSPGCWANFAGIA